jgi:hypothetical protein
MNRSWVRNRYCKCAAVRLPANCVLPLLECRRASNPQSELLGSQLPASAQSRWALRQSIKQATGRLQCGSGFQAEDAEMLAAKAGIG